MQGNWKMSCLPEKLLLRDNSIWGKWKSLSHLWLFVTPWNSPGQNTGVGSLSLLQGIFSDHGSNPGLPHCRQILYQLSHQGSPRILEWVTYPSSRGSSWSRNQTSIFCIAGGFFTSWATRDAHMREGGTQICVRWLVFFSIVTILLD